ncbi:MAG TPA: hypothetical protein VIL09_17740 [Microvirga sp.]|jgi:hypothetical protein
MKVAVLVWLTCAAIYVELLARAGRPSRSIEPGRWLGSAILYGGLIASLLWTITLAWLVARTLRDFDLIIR